MPLTSAGEIRRVWAGRCQRMSGAAREHAGKPSCPHTVRLDHKDTQSGCKTRGRPKSAEAGSLWPMA
eukprot:15532-Pyramimonas_sp.AAC.1